MHTTPSSIQELNKAYEPFTIVELEIAINKIKRKSPGQDTLTIDCFKHLGPGGKHRLLDVHKKIYSTGNFPPTWKHAIMVPILKKDKSAKDPASYRPISLLPVGGENLGIPHPHQTQPLHTTQETNTMHTDLVPLWHEHQH